MVYIMCLVTFACAVILLLRDDAVTLPDPVELGFPHSSLTSTPNVADLSFSNVPIYSVSTLLGLLFMISLLLVLPLVVNQMHCQCCHFRDNGPVTVSGNNACFNNKLYIS